MSKGIVIDIGKCTGCGYCEQICSFVHHGEFNPFKSRIHSSVFIEKSTAVPVVCYQCEEPWCLRACPANAITIKEDKVADLRIVVVDENLCVGCKMCTLACPFGCIVIAPEGYAEKCDLCGGDPQCVKFCRAGAISFKEIDQSVVVKRENLAKRLLSSYQEE